VSSLKSMCRERKIQRYICANTQNRPKEVFDTFNVNVMGAMNMTRNELAILRPQGHGVIANFGSMASWYGGPAYGYYSMTKWAISGFTEALHAEVAPLGIHGVIIEPGYFRTGLLNTGGDNLIETANKMEEEYSKTDVPEVLESLRQYNNKQPGDVVKGASIIVDVLTQSGVAEGREVPMRLLLGSDVSALVRKKLSDTEKLISEWEHIYSATNHDDVGASA
jgi:NAD(P)-dependent dehydrogenase (short-subunit alcohol dehydrogenase family)